MKKKLKILKDGKSSRVDVGAELSLCMKSTTLLKATYIFNHCHKIPMALFTEIE